MPPRIARALFLLILGNFLYACANNPQPEQSEIEPPPPAPSLPATQITDGSNFSADTLYALMVAELALDRGQFGVGLENYVEQARNTEDVRVVARAAQISRILGRHDEALEMAKLWRELDPGSREARLILVSELITAQQFEAALQQSEQLLEVGESAPVEEIAVEAARQDSQSLDMLNAQFETLREKFPNNLDVLIGSSVLQEANNELEQALATAQLATSQAPQDARALYQEYRVLSALKRESEATSVYGRIVTLQPDNFRIRSHYARLLIKEDREAALEQYQKLQQTAPSNDDIKLNIALLLQDTGREQEAAMLYQELIDADQHSDIAHYWLGEIAENRGDDAEALQHYLQIGPGKRFVDAISQAANVLVRKEGLENALIFLAAKRENATPEDKEQLFVVEADTLSRTGNSLRAFSIYNLGIKEFPSSIPLIYGRAMHHAGQSEFEEAEADFRRVLALDEKNAAALNALGYTLADNTERLDEAKTLIAQAYALRPNDAAILDSMGWVEFKLGNQEQALHFLERAYNIVQDHEIAAHYGEVLWTVGQKRAARQVWKQALESKPTSKIILNTLQRLKVKL